MNINRQEDVSFDLPLVKITEADVIQTLLIHTPFTEKMADSILKLQTWVLNYAEEQVCCLRDMPGFVEEEVEAIKRKICVISPLTISLYVHWLQMEAYIKMPYSEKERILLEKMPDRFRARYKGNVSCRQARELTEEEISAAKGDETDEDINADINRQRQSFEEFLKDFGETVQQALEKGDEK
mgnify:CR=1 FL=1